MPQRGRGTYRFVDAEGGGVTKPCAWRATSEGDVPDRAYLEDSVARGVIPEGFIAEDFEALGLAVPEQLRQPAPANPFACDSPE